MAWGEAEREQAAVDREDLHGRANVSLTRAELRSKVSMATQL